MPQQMNPGAAALLAIVELDREKFLLPAPQKQLRRERFEPLLSDPLRQFLAQRLPQIIGIFFNLRSVVDEEGQELAFLAEVRDIIYQLADDDLREAIRELSATMRVDQTAAYVALAIWVKHLGLTHQPPLLDYAPGRSQTLVWLKANHDAYLRACQQPSPPA